jgi:nucleoside-diphosphate-sugar epimerase
LEIAEKTMAKMGRGHVECIEWPNNNKLIDVGSVVLSGKKIKDCLGWTPKIKIDEGLIKSKNFYDKYLSLYLK